MFQTCYSDILPKIPTKFLFMKWVHERMETVVIDYLNRKKKKKKVVIDYEPSLGSFLTRHLLEKNGKTISTFGKIGRWRLQLLPRQLSVHDNPRHLQAPASVYFQVAMHKPNACSHHHTFSKIGRCLLH